MIWAVLILPLIVVVDWACWSKIDGMLSFPSARWRWRRRRLMPWAAMWVWIVVATKFLAPASEADWQQAVVVVAGLGILVWWMAAIYRDLTD